ncbi:carcinoembryonic antigen-related cell adhesion molecule 5-like isoform X1 [Salvelinus namaycush]|uniref:Carcinoembryonic antigen-related cell adhesion molecule 5-like isoform X1 n=1 Tax=Salvelinus namaycush TaxID=8040 RepID=A0A8U0QY56_SALNM|nr:carcinoembryonic antigen-related cell adhesion molecule 5-like isoform X1 [Salvelinus namaycush]
MVAAAVVFLTMGILSGYCAGQDVFPPGPVNGTLGGNVIFKTTINPNTLFAISWTFGEPPVPVVDFVSSAGPVIGVGYVGRISLDNSTGSLELRKLTLIDSGTYRVSLRTAAVIQVGSTSLIVYETISNVTLRANVIDLMELNDTAIFSCSVSSGSFPFSYRWLNGSSEVTARYRIQLGDGGRTLTIANVTRYDQGPYRCIVSNPVSSKPSQNLTLIISYGPENTTMKVTPLDVLYGSGSNLTLSCSAESSPSAQFQWLLNGTLLSNNRPELRLENIQANQSGSYSCWAHNTRTLRYQTSEPSDITVLEPISGANITTTPNSSIIEGGSVNLTCDASGAVITREWMKDGNPLSAGGNIIISEDKSMLSINPVKRTDTGEYGCRVSNPISTANAKHGLIVNYGPDGMEIMGPSEIEVGQKFTLTCSADSIPTSSYTWVLNGTEIPGHSPEFTKEKSEYSDSGDYTCTATNYVTGNKTSVVHKLSVKAKGSLTPGLSAGAIAGIVIGVLLVVGVGVGVTVFINKNGGSQQPVHDNPSPVYENTRQNQSPPLPLT